MQIPVSGRVADTLKNATRVCLWLQGPGSGAGILPLLPKIKTPLLLITGDMDVIVPHQTQARKGS